MYVAHLTRIGFFLHEIRQYMPDKRLETYLRSLEISRVRLAEQQEQLRLRNERTQRGFRVLTAPLPSRSICPRSPTVRRCVSISFVAFERKRLHLPSVKLRQYAAKQNIDIQGHFLGCYSDELPSGSRPFKLYIDEDE